MSFRYNEKEQSSILKLTHYFSRKRDAGVPLLPLNAVYNRVAGALEIYIRTVQKLATSGMETDKDYKIKVHAKDVSAQGSSIYIIHQYAIRTRVYAMYSAGLPALNLPPIDPVQISSIVIGAGTSAVNLVQNYHDVKVTGFSKLKVKNAHYDPEKKILTFVSLHPELKQEARYDINGKIMVIPVFGTGDSTILLRDVTIQHTIILGEKTKNNKVHLTATTYEVKMEIKGAHFDFRNLFNGDGKLAENILTVVNENWNVIFEDVKEGVQKAYGDVYKAITNGFFGKIPAEEIFLR